MTISYIGAAKEDINGTAASAVTTAAIANTQPGDLVFVFVKHEGASTTRTISDSAGGNSWTSRGSVSHINGDMHTEMFSCVLTNGAASHTFTCTLGAARVYFFVGALVYRSTVGWSYFDAAGAQGTSSTPSAGSKTPTGAYVAATGFGEYAAVTWTAGTGWTGTLTGTFSTSFVERRTNTTGETITGDASPSASMAWSAQMVVFLEAAGTTSDQEGFRFGVDDGSESAHTWSQAQDTNDFATVGTSRLIRALINGTGDLASAAYTLRYQKNGAGGYVPVPVGPGNAETYAQPTWGAAGTAASGTTSCTPAYPTGISASTSKLLCLVTGRSNTAGTVPTMPAGWTRIGGLEGGTGTWGVDTGTRRVDFFVKDTVDGTETGTVTVSLSGTTANTLRATIFRIEVPAGYSLDTELVSGADTSNDTAYSATASGDATFDSNRLVLIGTAQNIDTGTNSAQSITASGITFGTLTNRANTAVTNGNDHRHLLWSVPVSSGSGTVAPTFSYTISASGSGPTAFLVLRARLPAVTNEIYIAASANIAAGGEATTARLAAPSGKTTADFVVGRRWGDENGVDAIDITVDDYTEVEWSINTQAPATNGDYFDFRVYAGTSALNTYTVTPRLTLGSPPAFVPTRRRRPARGPSDVGPELATRAKRSGLLPFQIQAPTYDGAAYATGQVSAPAVAIASSLAGSRAGGDASASALAITARTAAAAAASTAAAPGQAIVAVDAVSVAPGTAAAGAAAIAPAAGSSSAPGQSAAGALAIASRAASAAAVETATGAAGSSAAAQGVASQPAQAVADTGSTVTLAVDGVSAAAAQATASAAARAASNAEAAQPAQAAGALSATAAASGAAVAIEQAAATALAAAASSGAAAGAGQDAAAAVAIGSAAGVDAAAQQASAAVLATTSATGSAAAAGQATGDTGATIFLAVDGVASSPGQSAASVRAAAAVEAAAAATGQDAAGAVALAGAQGSTQAPQQAAAEIVTGTIVAVDGISGAAAQSAARSVAIASAAAAVTAAAQAAAEIRATAAVDGASQATAQAAAESAGRATVAVDGVATAPQQAAAPQGEEEPTAPPAQGGGGRLVTPSFPLPKRGRRRVVAVDAISSANAQAAASVQAVIAVAGAAASAAQLGTATLPLGAMVADQYLAARMEELDFERYVLEHL